jgi:uncharacterized protein
MKFVREPGSAVTVRHVEPGKIKIGNEELIDNVVLFRDEIRRDWQPADIDNPTSQDLAELIREKPEVIIFGTGWQARLPPRELVFALARRGIGFEMMDTPAACRTFNVLVSEDRDVAAVLILN